MVAAAAVGYLVGLIALRRTGIYFAMITVAIAEVFFFVEFNPLSAYTGGENGLPGVPTPALNLGFTTIHFNTDTVALHILRVLVLHRHGHRAADRALAGGRGAARDPRQSAASRRGRPQHPRYKLTAFVIAAAYAGFAGGLLGVMQGFMPPDAFMFDTSGQLVMQTAIGGAGTLFGPLVGATRVAVSQRFPSDHAAPRRHLEARSRPCVRAAGLLPAPRHRRRTCGPWHLVAGRDNSMRRAEPEPLPSCLRASQPFSAATCQLTPCAAPPTTTAGDLILKAERLEPSATAVSPPTTTSTSPFGTANCAASSAQMARARPRSSKC